MSFRTIFILSVLLIAAILGGVQNVTLPMWAWVIWGILLVIAVIAWVVVSRAVSWAVRRAILAVPVSGRVSPEVGGFRIPVSEIRGSADRIEEELARVVRFRPVAWMVRRAFRMQAEGYVGSIIEHCESNRVEVLDGRVFAAWTHGKVADTVAETAAEIASGFWMIAVIVLVCVGIAFALPHFR